MLYSVVSLCSLLGLAHAHPPLTGAVVAVQSRCQGFQCPNWAMDVSRYDTIMYADTEQFEYTLNENLPLGPTSERGFETYSAYSKDSRTFVSVAADYSVGGVDSYWMHTINDAVNGTTPLKTNVMVAHPDATPDHPGSMKLARILLGPNDRLVALFNDGSIHDVDLDTQSYTRIASLYERVSFSKPSMTYAHVFHGSVLKSFIMDPNGGTYLVKIDFSADTLTATDPLTIKYIPHMDFGMTPINALVTATNPAMEPQLMVIITGSFDQLQYVNEETGELIDTISNLFETTVPALFACYESTKDCDFWRTAAYDEDNNLIYVQAHTVDGQGTQSTTMLKIGFTQSKVNGVWYPYVNTAMWPMSFGYSGYQYATIKA